MGAPITPEQAVASRRDWRVLLEREYSATAGRLQAAYTRTVKQLEPLAKGLDQRLIEIYEATGKIGPSDVRGMPQYARLLARIEIEMKDFAVITRAETDALASRAVLLGGDTAQSMTLAEAGNSAGLVRAAWLRPNPEALERLVGFVDSDVFRAKWLKFGEAAAQQFGDTLLAGMAMGKNPRAVARLVRAWLGVPYNWAENSSRTAMIWSFRLGNHATFAANGHIVEGWYWDAALDLRTCISCWNQHGTFHPNTEILNDHHRGRCAPRPKVFGVTPTFASGRQAFEALPDAQQRAIMGKGLHTAWRDGRAKWDDMSRPYHDDLYGDMLRQPTLKALGIGR
jgi:hypothetical protein